MLVLNRSLKLICLFFAAMCSCAQFDPIAQKPNHFSMAWAKWFDDTLTTESDATYELVITKDERIRVKLLELVPTQNERFLRFSNADAMYSVRMLKVGRGIFRGMIVMGDSPVYIEDDDDAIAFLQKISTSKESKVCLHNIITAVEIFSFLRGYDFLATTADFGQVHVRDDWRFSDMEINRRKGLWEIQGVFQSSVDMGWVAKVYRFTVSDKGKWQYALIDQARWGNFTSHVPSLADAVTMAGPQSEMEKSGGGRNKGTEGINSLLSPTEDGKK